MHRGIVGHTSHLDSARERLGQIDRIFYRVINSEHCTIVTGRIALYNPLLRAGWNIGTGTIYIRRNCKTKFRRWICTAFDNEHSTIHPSGHQSMQSTRFCLFRFAIQRDYPNDVIQLILKGHCISTKPDVVQIKRNPEEGRNFGSYN